MNISVIIPNYNGEKIIGKNLASVINALLNFKGGKKEIIVTDDCSKDNSLQVINAFIDDNDSGIPVKLITSNLGYNMGFSSNVNKGVHSASGEIVILLNTDVLPSSDFIDPLIIHFQDPKVFAVGCMDESVEGDEITKRGRGVGNFKRGFLNHSLGHMDKPDTLWVSGGSGAFRKNIWDELGGLDPLFNPFYWEDIDLSYRALKSGYKLVFEKKCVVRHEHDKGSIKKQYTESRVKKTSYRNQILFVWLNITDNNLLLSHFLWLPFHITSTLLRGDSGLLFGFFAALVRIPSVISSRSKRTKRFNISDHEVLLPFRENIND